MTGPSYTVKNIKAIAEGSDMRARLYTLAPGDVIPWHYHTAVTDWYFVRPVPLYPQSGKAHSGPQLPE